MTKQQATLLLFVLIIIGGGVTYYVTQSNAATPSSQTQTDSKTSTTNTLPTNTTQAPSNTIPATTTTKSPTATTPSSKKLTDKVSYDVPEGDIEALTVNVTVDANGKITDVTFAFDTPTNHDSRHYQNSFTASFSASALVGKKLSDAKISRTGGASLATDAFNRALSDLATKVNS